LIPGWSSKPIRLLFLGLLVLISLLPLVNIIHIVVTNGEDNLSNDYLRTAPLVDKILSGNYQWGSYFHDTFLNQVHSYAALFLIQLGLIKLTGWSVYGEISTGIGLAVIRLVLVKRILQGEIKGYSHLLLWPFLAALLFSNSQISTFTYGETALQMGLVQLGITAGIYGLIVYPGRWTSLGIAGVGGMLASFSGGSGLLAWPVFFLGILLTWPRKKWLPLSVLGVMALAGAFPYSYYGIFLAGPASGLSMINGRILDLEFILTALGYPFANQIAGGYLHHPQALRIGIIGVVTAIIGLMLLAG
jgi:hypothetical protein